MKEGDPPWTIYFILSGEVEIYRRAYDQTKHTYLDKLDFISGPGDCLGDIEMIEECNRINTYISRNEVELLVLYEEEFNKILRPTMSRLWMERKAALQALEYFKYLNRDQIIAACKLGLIRQFDPLETIFYEDKGHVSYVHFVLSGECMILQCLKLKVTTKKGGKIFQLVDISECDNDDMFQDPITFSSLRISKDGGLRNVPSFFDVDYEIMSEEDDGIEKEKHLLKKMDMKGIEVSCGLVKRSDDTSGKKSRFSKEYLDENDELEELSEFSEFSYTQHISPEYPTEYPLTSPNQVRTSEIYRKRAYNSTSEENISPSELLENSDNFRELTDSLRVKIESEEMNKLMKPTSNKQDSSTKVENHFIDVGSITFGGIFSLGEKLVHRVIMARTTVQCLMLPRYWLLEKDQNPGNVWQRRRFYLDSTMPSREQLFKDFLTTRTWQKFKNIAISSNLTRHFGNPTKVQDIPIICRIVEPAEE